MDTLRSPVEMTSAIFNIFTSNQGFAHRMAPALGQHVVAHTDFLADDRYIIDLLRRKF